MGQKILVTGAAGQLGRRVIHHLLETYKVPAGDIIAATRNPEQLAELAARGITTRRADFDDAASLATAFAGADRLLIISTDALAQKGHRLAQHKAAVEAAAKAGAKHFFYTSMPAPDNSLVSFAPDHLGTEQAIKASGVDYTIFRNAWYWDNFLHSLPHSLQEGKWYSSSGDGQSANISREDCALAIAAGLASATVERGVLTLTGPQLLTAEEIAALAAEIAGKPLQVVHIDDKQLAAGLASAGLPGFFVDVLVSADANIRAGNFAFLTDDFRKLTGKDPQSARSFFEAHRAALTA